MTERVCQILSQTLFVLEGVLEVQRGFLTVCPMEYRRDSLSKRGWRKP